MQSSISNVIKSEDNLRNGNAYSNQPGRMINNKERVSHDIFGCSDFPEDKPYQGRKKISNHLAAQTNGNLIQWEK